MGIEGRGFRKIAEIREASGGRLYAKQQPPSPKPSDGDLALQIVVCIVSIGGVVST